MPNKYLNEFNNPDTFAIISPYLEKGENFCGFSVARYTKLLVSSFPKTQKIVIFGQIGGKTRKISENILFVPTYKVNSRSFLKSLISAISRFENIKKFLIQFEFSIYGGKIVLVQVPVLIALLKLMGKNVNITLHQIVTDLGILSGHLAIRRKGVKTAVLNAGLRTFYSICGRMADKMFVHDEVLAARLSKFVAKEKIKVIPHGAFEAKVFTKKFEKASKKYFGIKRGYKTIGIFGFCSWYKGTDWMIKNFARFARSNPKVRARLLVAGGESPTLRGTHAYRLYHEKLMKVIREANGNIIYTGFIPEKEVKKVFAASYLMVFPYRVRMSASGAFSLSQSYQKPYLVSRAFAGKGTELGNIFDLNYESFEKVLAKALKSQNKPVNDSLDRSWNKVAAMYLSEISESIKGSPDINYAEVI